jgi:hypothetical protein
MEEWIEIHEQEGKWTYAANIPGGCLIRNDSSFYGTSSITFVPGVKVTKKGKLLRDRDCYER